MKKKEKAVMKVISLAEDVLSLGDLEGFPKLEGMDNRDLAILCLSACGFSQGFIASAIGISQPSVWERMKRSDPNRMFVLSPNAKRAFMTRLAESRGLAALAYITPEKLENSSAKELMGIGKDAVAIAQQLNQSKHREVSASRLDSLMKMVESDAIDGEYSMEEVV